MAELTNLESKLGEVTGLATAAKAATATVIKLVRPDHRQLVPELQQMKEEAAETERRCKEVAAAIDGKKTAILSEAKETREKATRMLEIYLDGSSDALDGFEFLTMAEAGEVGHWEVLQQMGKKAGRAEVKELVRWALPIQKRHLDTARKTSALLAAAKEPDEEE